MNGKAESEVIDPEMKPPKVRCSNCQKKLKASFKYCPKCGQRITTHRVSLGILVTDFFREELHLNNKAIRTFRKLFLQPGQLTLEYIAGRKKSLLTPTKLFVWTGFLMIAVLITAVNRVEWNGDGENGPIQVNTGAGDEEPGEFGQAVLGAVDRANENPQLFFQTVLRRLPFVLLALLPAFAGLMKLFYRKRKIYYLEHLVFLLHLAAFGFLLFAVSVTLSMIGAPGIVSMTIALGILFMYFLLSYKRVYRHRWLGTILRGSLIGLLFFLTIPTALIFVSVMLGLFV